MIIFSAHITTYASSDLGGGLYLFPHPALSPRVGKEIPFVRE